MSTNGRIALFGTLYVVIFVAAMVAISGGVLDAAALVSIPIILSSEVLVLGMIYLNAFHSEAAADDPAKFNVPKVGSYEAYLPKREKEHSR
jgi:hypothetical protein